MTEMGCGEQQYLVMQTEPLFAEYQWEMLSKLYSGLHLVGLNSTSVYCNFYSFFL